MIVRFEEEAQPIPTRRNDWIAFAALLRANPGQWALFGQYPGTPGGARQYTYVLRHGGRIGLSTVPKATAFDPVGSFEFTLKTLFEEQRIYVRYVGDIPRQRAGKGTS